MVITLVVALTFLAQQWQESTTAARTRASMLAGHSFKLDKKEVTGEPGYRLLYVSFLSPEGLRASYRLREGKPGFDNLITLTEGQTVRFCERGGWIGLSARHYTLGYVSVCVS
ncbi:MAG TPA: hypothetical protein VJZ91_06250 [Blastocatellia bacterium]|nr:hypothetical protein [Blastocatellia bacterium]